MTRDIVCRLRDPKMTVHGRAGLAEEAADKIEGLEADLCSAIEVAWDHGAKYWVRANYRANADLFEQGD